ncbi:MAG: hypothetical protein HDR88_07470 [Bacteroides sp.]|nr:hypothetical protein [Bacteroides sp.]
MFSPSPSEGLCIGNYHGNIAYPFSQSLPFQCRQRTRTETRMGGRKQIPYDDFDTNMSGTRMSV